MMSSSCSKRMKTQQNCIKSWCGSHKDDFKWKKKRNDSVTPSKRTSETPREMRRRNRTMKLLPESKGIWWTPIVMIDWLLCKTWWTWPMSLEKSWHCQVFMRRLKQSLKTMIRLNKLSLTSSCLLRNSQQSPKVTLAISTQLRKYYLCWMSLCMISLKK